MLGPGLIHTPRPAASQQTSRQERFWYKAHRVIKTFAWMLNKHAEGTDCATACAQARDRFLHFWNSRGAALYDVIDESDGDPSENRQRYDVQLRLDSIFAVSPPHNPLDPARKKAVVDAGAHKVPPRTAVRPGHGALLRCCVPRWIFTDTRLH